MHTFKKIITLFLLLNTLVIVAQDIPEGYYNKIDQKQNNQLKTALHNILKDHIVLKYNNLWTYYRTTDNKGNNVVWDMYSNTVRYFNANGGNSSTSGMNREHSLPKSWWAISSEVDNYAAYSDLHHLYPADGDANMKKSNYMLGEISSPSYDNGVSKVGKNSYNYTGSPSANAFEPDDEYKGDFARTYFYMITCYEDYAQQWRSDATNMFNKEYYPVLKDWAKDMLLKWHRNDPVSIKELDRNEEVYKYQSNRNPFIDFPQLVEYIWGDSVSYVFTLPEIHKTGDPTLISPTNKTEIFMGDIKKSDQATQSILVKGINLTSNLSLLVWGGNSNYFSLSTSSVPVNSANSDGGYELIITYYPLEYGEHETSLLISDGGLEGSVIVSLSGICSLEGSGDDDDDDDNSIPQFAQFGDVYTEYNDIVYRTYSPSDSVAIYDYMGRLIYTNKGTGHWERYTCSNSGVYIIVINQKSRKIIVK